MTEPCIRNAKRSDAGLIAMDEGEAMVLMKLMTASSFEDMKANSIPLPASMDWTGRRGFYRLFRNACIADGFAAVFGVVQLFDGGEEGVHVHEGDDARPVVVGVRHGTIDPRRIRACRQRVDLNPLRG